MKRKETEALVETKELDKQSRGIISTVDLGFGSKLRMFTEDELPSAINHLKGIRALLKDVDSTFDPIIQLQHQAHKKSIATKKEKRAPLEVREKLLDWGITQRL